MNEWFRGMELSSLPTLSSKFISVSPFHEVSPGSGFPLRAPCYFLLITFIVHPVMAGEPHYAQGTPTLCVL